MIRMLVVLMALMFCACTDGGQPATQQGSTAHEQPAGGSAAEPPDQQMISCLNRFREKKYEEAIAVCGQALKSNPGDPQIQKAIELSKEALNGGA